MATAIPPTTGSPVTAKSLPLTRGRVAALVIGVPACLALVAAAGFSNLATFAEGSSPASFTVPATTTALTLNVNGDLTIRPTTAARVRFTGTARYTFVRSAPTEHTSVGATTIGYDCEIPTGECGLNGTVTVPKSVTTLTSNTGAGDATVTGMTGPVSLSTGEGNLSVSHTSGPLTLTTGSGDITVSGAVTPAAFSASSGDGNIKVTGVSSAAITANTDSGNISWSGVKAAAVTASSGDGNITIFFTSVPRDVQVNTDSGGVTLVVPNDSPRYHILANSDSGAVSYPSSLQSESSPNVITASTGSGAVTIETLSEYRSQP